VVLVLVELQLEVTDPRPPPTCPTITSDVGTGRLFVRLIVRSCEGATVMTTGAQLPLAAEFNAAHVPFVAVPQEYPHIGTTAPSGSVTVELPAVRVIVA
jgi:hypothetical protein